MTKTRKTIVKREQFPVTENWRVRAFPKGTVDLSAYVNARDPGGRWAIKGQMILPNSPPVAVIGGTNLIVSVGKYLVGDILIDVAGYDTGLTYHAIGSDNTAPVVADATLTVEESRKAVTTKSRLLNVITYSTFFTAAESTYNIKESGIFGHSTASAAADSGILFSHYLAAFDNSLGTYDLTYDYILTIG